MKRIFYSTFVAIALMTSCSNDDESNGGSNVVAPTTYEFLRNGTTTVSFSGQTTRIAMAGEFVSALTDNTKTEAELDAMFAHSEGDNDFSDADLNASSKNIRSKTAASTDYFSTNTTLSNAIKSDFDSWIAEQAATVFVSWGVTATAGNAGQLQQAGGGSVRYVNDKGLELNQAVAKGLIGGLMVDQMLNNYLSASVLDAGDNVSNNNNDITEVGRLYTTMEHKWDEAYGYLYGAEANPETPVLGADGFLNKYLNSVDSDDDFSGIADNVYQALKLGRAAIVAKDYDLRDEQVQIIRENISTVIAVRTVHYLQAGKESLEAENVDYAKAFHELSEGYGFLYSLQFTRRPNSSEPYFTNEEVNAYIETLMEGNGFWGVSSETLDSISAEIATRFGFTVDAAVN